MTYHALFCYLQANLQDLEMISKLSSYFFTKQMPSTDSHDKDLVALLHLRLQGKENAGQSFIADMSDSDWCGHLRKDVRDLCKLSFKALLHRCRTVWLCTPLGKRSQSLQDWLDVRLTWVSPGYNPQVLVADPEMKKHLVEYTDVLLSLQSTGHSKPGQSKIATPSALALAKKVSSGALQGQEVLEFLLSAAVEKADKLQRGLTRVNSSGDPEMMAQLAWTLGQSIGKKAIGGLFGLNMARPASLDLRSSLVPFFYCAQGSVLVSLVWMQVLDQSKTTYFQDDQDLASQNFEYRAAITYAFCQKSCGCSLNSIWQHPFISI